MRVIIIVILIFLATITNNAQWSYFGLGNTKTTDLTIYNDTLYASTYTGIYKKSVLSSDTIWFPCGMQGTHVVQTLVPEYQTFICVAEINSSYTTQMYKSIDGGDSFSLMKNSISLTNSYNYLDKIAHAEGNYDTLYFLDHQLSTFNGGSTWDTLSNIIDLVNRFIKVNPENHHQILIGGETMFFGPYLQTSLDDGENWDMLPNMASYFAGDNVVHDMVIDGTDWFAVGEGVIGKTSDGGTSWEQLLNIWDYPAHWGLYITDIEFSPNDKNILYATGHGYAVDIIPLLYSPDSGITWDTLSCKPANLPNDSQTNVTCLAVKNTSEGDKVFIGGEGIYKYKKQFTGIPHTTSGNRFTIFPNPASSEFTITIPPSVTEVQIIDVQGSVLVKRMTKGQTELSFEIQNMGIYFVQIITNNSIVSQKLIVQ